MKKISVTILGVFMMMMLAACGGNKLDSSTAEKYIAKAEEVIHLLNEAQYEDLHSMFNHDMQVGLPVENMAELTPVIEASGSFEKIDKASAEEDKGLYITVLVAKYKNNKRIYTITFDGDDKIAGLYIN